jgi:Family of unknown function (DUF5362)
MEEENVVREVGLPIFESKGWLKLLGVVMIVQGILSALTVVGILICWLPIWLGALLFQAAGAAEGAQINGDKGQLLTSLSKIKMYFMINGILMLIVLIGAAVVLLISGGAIFSLMHRL